MKTSIGKKRSRDEAAGSAQGSKPATSPPAPESEQRVEEIQGEDLRPAGAGEQRFPLGEGDGHVARHRGRSIPVGAEYGPDTNQ
jgi:hypothetical protein